MFCGIDFMAIWFFLKESVLILLASIITSTISTNFSKVLSKVKFGPENSLAFNKFLEQLLIEHENLEWVDKLSQTYSKIGLSNSGIEMRRNILKRDDRHYRMRRKVKPYHINYRNRRNQNFNPNEVSHLNINDYENALTGVLKKEGYKRQRVKQKRYIMETPTTTHKYRKHTTFDILDLSIFDPSKKGSTNNCKLWIRNNNLRKAFAENKLKKQAITTDDYVEYTERSTNCGSKPTVNIKAEELEELLKVVEPITKRISTKNYLKNKTLGIMNSKKNELTITKSLDIRQNKFETTVPPIIVIVMESAPIEKTLKKKSVTIPEANKASIVNAPVNMIPKKTIIQSHLEKNIFLDSPHVEQQIDASPSNANIKSVNLDSLHIMTDPYIVQLTETTVPNVPHKNNLQKRQKIVEDDPATVMSPEEIRRAKIEAKKLMDVDKDFNERNEPDFNKEVMKTLNNDYKETYDYWDLKNNIKQKQKSNNIQSEEKIRKSEEKREIKSDEIKPNESQENSFFSRQLLHYNYNDDYENQVYSDYEDQESSLRRYPRDLNQNYRFQNVGDDYFEYQNEQPLEKRYYKKRWKKEANRNKEKGLFNKKELRNKITKLKDFFGFGHENNYNENVEDDYPVENMAIDDYTAKNNEFFDNPDGLQNINEPEVSSENINNNYYDQQNNFDVNVLDQNSLARTTFSIKSDNTLNLNEENEQNNKNSIDINSERNHENSFEQSTLKDTKENNQNSVEQSMPTTKLTSNQNTPTKQNSIQNDWHRNLEISSIIETTFSNTLPNLDHETLKPNTKARTTNSQSSTTEKLILIDFNNPTTTTLNPLSYSFSYKMNLFDTASTSSTDSPLPMKIEKFGDKVPKRESNLVKNLLGHYFTKQNSKIIPETHIKDKSDDEKLTEQKSNDAINTDKSLSLNDKKNKKKLTNKYKFHHHLPKYHSKLKDLLKSLPPQIPVAQMHVDELKLNAIKKNQEKIKKSHSNIRVRKATDFRADKTYDLDDEDYIPSDYEDSKNSNSVFFNDVEKLKHCGQMVKDDTELSNVTKKCGTKHKSHKNRPDIEEEKNALKVVGRPKIEDTIKPTINKIEKNNLNDGIKKQDKAPLAEDTKKINALQTVNKQQDQKKINDVQDPQFYITGKNTEHYLLKNSCHSSTKFKINNTTKYPTTTKVCSTKRLTTKFPTTAMKYPSKKSCFTTTCKTTHPTTCKTKTCPTTCKTTTCPTTCKTTTCPTTCKRTTCPTTCKTTTCPTTCKTTTCPTTCKTTTCPTTCKTTCPTTCKTTCPTTCKTTCPTTCKTTTCPTTCKTTTKKCKTTCKTTKCPTTCSKCTHAYSTHKFGKKNNFFERSKRKIIYNSQYFDNNYHKAKFKADCVSRHLIFPKKKYLYDDMPRNEYQEMKHKNLVSRLKRRYFPRQNKNFAETRENSLIRRKKSINLNEDMKYNVDMPIYKVYPKRIRYQRYRRRKMKNDDETEDEKQRKVLETIYHRRILRRRNEPEYVRKSHSYDNTNENNANLPSSYNSEVKRNLFQKSTADNLNNDDFKGATPSESNLSSDALEGKVPAKVVQDLFDDINKCKEMKNIIGKALRSPRRDPNNPFPSVKKCQDKARINAEKQLQQIIDDTMKKLNDVVKAKVAGGNCIKLDKDAQLFIRIITANIKKASELEIESDIPSQGMNLFVGKASNSSVLNCTISNTSIASTRNDIKFSFDPCKTPTCDADSSKSKTSTVDPCKTVNSTTTCKPKSSSVSTNDPCKTSSPATTAKTKLTQTKDASLNEFCQTMIITCEPSESETTEISRKKAKTKTTKCKTTKRSTTKATKSTKCKTKKIKTTTTCSTLTEVSKTQSTTVDPRLKSAIKTERTKGKSWGKPLKLKVEVFKFNDTKTCEPNTTEPSKTQTQCRKKLEVKFDRRMGFKRSDQLKHPLNVHKEKKFSNVQAAPSTTHNLPLTHQEVTNLLAMFNKLPLTEKRSNKHIYNYLHTQKLLLERLMRQFTAYNRQHRKIKIRKRQNYHQPRRYVIWEPNESSDSSNNSNYIKLKKRRISDDQRENFRRRIKRENYFRDIMRARRKPDSTISKLDQWMNVKNEEHKPLYFNFTF